MESECKKTIWAGRVVSGLAAAPFLLSSAMKFAGAPNVMQGFDHLGWPQTMILRLGILEAACVLFYLVPATSVFGAVLLTGYIGGAIATHLRIGEPVIAQSIIGVLIWLGIYLRDSRLAELLPVRAKDFKYEREITISRSHHEVFSYLRPLNNFRNWNPFLRKDPQAKLESRGTDGQVGYVAAWEGNRDMGSGEQEITRIVDGERIEFELRFKKPFKATNRGYFSTESVGGSQTKVRWGMTGKSMFPMSLIGLFIDCEKMIGNEFDWGLKQLKSILEK